jgi:hypothetical protein
MLSTVIMSTPKLPSQQAAFGFGDYGHAGLGIFFHQPMIISGSVVALFLPLETSFPSGCLPGLLQFGFPQAQPSFSGHLRGIRAIRGLHSLKQLQGGSFSK